MQSNGLAPNVFVYAALISAEVPTPTARLVVSCCLVLCCHVYLSSCFVVSCRVVVVSCRVCVVCLVLSCLLSCHLCVCDRNFSRAYIPLLALKFSCFWWCQGRNGSAENALTLLEEMKKKGVVL
jgi:pentatricopeptide repeat protein